MTLPDHRRLLNVLSLRGSMYHVSKSRSRQTGAKLDGLARSDFNPTRLTFITIRLEFSRSINIILRQLRQNSLNICILLRLSASDQQQVFTKWPAEKVHLNAITATCDSDSLTGKTGGKTGGKAGADTTGKSQKSHSAKAGLQVRCDHHTLKFQRRKHLEVWRVANHIPAIRRHSATFEEKHSIQSHHCASICASRKPTHVIVNKPRC